MTDDEKQLIRDYRALCFDLLFGKIAGEEEKIRTVGRFNAMDKRFRELGIKP